MISRTTMSTTVRNFLADLQTNSRELDRAQHQVSTGKRISSPSDDPVGITAALRIRSDRASTQAWKANIEDSITWLGATDTALGNGVDVVQRARELAVQGANGTLSAAGKSIIADEIDHLRAQMIEVGNATLGGRHLFSGSKTLTQAFDATGAFQGTTANLNREVDLGATVSVNVTGDRLAGPGGATPDIFQTLGQLSAALRAADSAGIQTAISRLDAHLTNLNALRGEVGGKTNKLEMTLSRQATTDLSQQDQLSQIEDIDMAEAITRLQSRENVYRASLGVGGRVLPPSLLDFLK